MKALKAKNGSLSGRTFYLVKSLVIGRHPACDIVLESDRVSRRHAMVLIWTNGKILLRDLKSLNGVYVGGRRVRQVELNPGDVFAVAGCKFELHSVEVGASIRGPSLHENRNGDPAREDDAKNERRKLLSFARRS